MKPSGHSPVTPRPGWSCSMCTASNTTDVSVCRVCRTSSRGARGALPRTLEEDSFAPASLWHVLPLSLALFVAGAFAASQVPKASTWSGGVAPGGWQVGVRVNRAHELRIAVRDLRLLVEEYQRAVDSGQELDEDWTSRLAALRKTWELYGDGARFPGLEHPEVELGSATQELASLRAVDRDGGADPAVTAAGLMSVSQRIQKTEEILADVE